MFFYVKDKFENKTKPRPRHDPFVAIHRRLDGHDDKHTKHDDDLDGLRDGLHAVQVEVGRLDERTKRE